MFFICSYLDAERWTSGLEPLLYPNGMSFYRPFSYRHAYFHPEQLADQLTDQNQCKSLLDTNWNEGFVGIRFRDPGYEKYLSMFVPLRKIRITSVDASDQINVGFQLLGYVQPVRQPDNSVSMLPSVDLAGVVPDVTSIKLFVGLRDVDRAATTSWNVVDYFPPGMWDAFERTISPAAKDQILHTVLLRLISIKKRGESKAIENEEIDRKNHVWGIRLREGTAYDLVAGYFRIRELGIESPTIEHQFVLTNPQEELHASRRSIQINANYRNETMWIQPRAAGPGPIQLSIEPCKLGDTKVVDPKTAKMIGLIVPLIVDRCKWPQKRKINLFIGIACTILVLVCIGQYTHASHSTQAVVLLVIAGLISLAAGAFKEVLLY